MQYRVKWVHHSFDTPTETINDWQNVIQFANINISQGSVATHLRWGEIFINNFIPRFVLNVSLKELWKSVNI